MNNDPTLGFEAAKERLVKAFEQVSTPARLEKMLSPVQMVGLNTLRQIDKTTGHAMSLQKTFDAMQGVMGALPNAARKVISDSTPTSSPLNTVSDLGHLIKTARKEQKLSQQELADLAGVGRRFLSELENGKPSLEFGKVLEVCQAAGIDLMAVRRP